MITEPPLQKILQGILNTENESKQNHVSNHRRRKDKKSESNIDSSTHNKTLKQNKQLNDKNHHIPININTEY
jgi:hypothetical protein